MCIKLNQLNSKANYELGNQVYPWVLYEDNRGYFLQNLKSKMTTTVQNGIIMSVLVG